MPTDTLSLIWDRESKKYVDRPIELSHWPFPKNFLPKKDARVLDAGCGAGTYLGMFQSLTQKRHGVDISPEMVKAASRYGNCLVGDVRKLPFVDSHFDYVLSNLVLSHCGDFHEGFSEVVRVCKREGEAIVVLPNQNSAFAWARWVAQRLGIYTLGSCEHFTRKKMKRLAASEGLQVVGCWVWHRTPECTTRFRQAIGLFAYTLDSLVRLFFPHLWGDCLVWKFKKV